MLHCASHQWQGLAGLIARRLSLLFSRSVTSVVSTLCDPWTAAHQAPLSMGFPRQEYWSGLPFPSPGDLPDPGIKPGSPALQAVDLPTELWGKPILSLPCDKACGEQVRPASDLEGWALLQQDICHDQYRQSRQGCPALSRSSKKMSIDGERMQGKKRRWLIVKNTWVTTEMTPVPTGHKRWNVSRTQGKHIGDFPAKLNRFSGDEFRQTTTVFFNISDRKWPHPTSSASQHRSPNRR